MVNFGREVMHTISNTNLMSVAFKRWWMGINQSVLRKHSTSLHPPPLAWTVHTRQVESMDSWWFKFYHLGASEPNKATCFLSSLVQFGWACVCSCLFLADRSVTHMIFCCRRPSISKLEKILLTTIAQIFYQDYLFLCSELSDLSLFMLTGDQQL